MRLSDAASGLVFLGVGLAIVVAGWRMPSPAGLAVGPGLFPMVIGGAMALFGALIALQGLLREGVRGFIALDPWMRHPRAAAAFVAVPLAIGAYLIGTMTAGFLAGSVALVLIAALAWHERPLPALLVAVVGSLAIFIFFAGVLRVPLPRGPIEGALSWIF